MLEERTHSNAEPSKDTSEVMNESRNMPTLQGSTEYFPAAPARVLLRLNNRRKLLEKPKKSCRYQISVKSDDLSVLDHVGELLMNQLPGSGKEYQIEYRLETKASSFIRWLLE